MANRIELVKSFLSRHRGVVKVGDRSVTTATTWEEVVELLSGVGWYGVDLKPVPGDSVSLQIEGCRVGQIFIPPCAVFVFQDLEGKVVASLEIWIDRPRMQIDAGVESVEGIVDEPAYI